MKSVYDKNGKKVGYSFQRTNLRRTSLTKNERNSMLEKHGQKDKNGFYIDANDKSRHSAKKTDLGHKYGYEETPLRRCAERVGMDQKSFDKMMKNADIYQSEYFRNNRSHKYECKDSKTQRRNAFKLIRDFLEKNKNNNKNKPEAKRNFKNKFSKSKVSFKAKKGTVKRASSKSKVSIGKTVSQGKSPGGAKGFGGSKGGSIGAGKGGGGKGGGGGGKSAGGKGK